MSPSPSAHVSADLAVGKRDFRAARAIFEKHLYEEPGDFDGWMKLAAICRISGDYRAALDAADAALALRPNFYLSLLLKGTLLRRLGHDDQAYEILQAALFHAEFEELISETVMRELQGARSFLTQRATDAKTRMEIVLAKTSGITDGGRRSAARFFENVIQRRPIFHQEPTHFRYPGLADVEYFDNYDREFIAAINASTTRIHEELVSLIESDDDDTAAPYVNFRPGEPVGQWSELNQSSRWSAIHLIRHGEVVSSNASRCPATMNAFLGVQPDIAGLAPNLMFSILAPRTTIPPHHGVANFRSVLHLPLIVPADCRFRVGADTRSWRKGEAWVFDDTIEHEAWNDSDEPRVILIADVWRPELTEEDRSVIRAFFAAMPQISDIGSL